MQNQHLSDTTGIPRIGDPAPAFEAPSTQGTVRLSDFKGRWLVLFSHPADFTPVCTTEFVAFARAAGDFEAMGVALLGLSIDSVFAHIAWTRSIEQHFGVSVPFPVIADLSTEVARAYGMLHPGASGTATVRAVFIIDPEQKIRALLYYPMTAGRAVSEIKRLVQALQVGDRHGLATPESWEPGKPCIVPPPATSRDAQARVADARFQVTDWYLATTPQPL